MFRCTSAVDRPDPCVVLQRLRARHDFDDLARDRRLAHLVHVERQAVDHFLRVARRASIAVMRAACSAADDSSSAR